MSEDDFIHGKLEIIIYEARGLPDTDNMLWGLIPGDLTDPYVTIHLDSVKVAQTSTKNNTLNPEWAEKYSLDVCHRATALRFVVRDKDHAGSEYIGEVQLRIGQDCGVVADGWFPIKHQSGDCRSLGELRVRAVLESGEKLGEEYYRRVMEDVMTNQYLLPSYFPARTECQVDLYSCASNISHPVSLGTGESYQPGSCWLDLYRDLVRAEKFIYITGWSVWTELKLLRGDDRHSLGNFFFKSQSPSRPHRYREQGGERDEC